jgi:hypothetical protein
MDTMVAKGAGATLALGIGWPEHGSAAVRRRARRLLSVRDLADASARYVAYREREERAGRGGVSRVPLGRVYEVRGGDVRPIGTVSYNGKVWPDGEWSTDIKPLYDPYTQGGAR